MWRRILGLEPRLPPAISDTVNELAQQRYAKQAKLDTAHDAIMTQDWQLQAADLRRRQNKLEAKTMGNKKAEDDAGNIIVCDDYNANQFGSMGRGVIGLLAGLLIGGGTAAAVAYNMGLFDKEKPAATANGDTDTTFKLKLLNGEDEKP